MQTLLSRSKPSGLGRRAFTVVELLVAVTVMTLVVFTLYQMFYQTQKALKGNITQVDVLESGRAALEMISRELEQISASDLAGTTNFYAGLIPSYQLSSFRPVFQTDLDEKTFFRTNLIEEFFFLSRITNTWTGTGYRVIGADQGVGTLYRFSVATNYHFLASNNLSGAYFREPLTNPITRVISTNFHRVADGIIHLRLAAYDSEGRPLRWRAPFERTNFYPRYNVLWNPGRISPTNNVALRTDRYGQTQLIFLSNALPAYVELELGFLEPTTLAQFQSLRETSDSVARDFLKKRASKVHLFRKQIPIRTASQ